MNNSIEELLYRRIITQTIVEISKKIIHEYEIQLFCKLFSKLRIHLQHALVERRMPLLK